MAAIAIVIAVLVILYCAYTLVRTYFWLRGVSYTALMLLKSDASEGRTADLVKQSADAMESVGYTLLAEFMRSELEMKRSRSKKRSRDPRLPGTKRSLRTRTRTERLPHYQALEDTPGEHPTLPEDR
jgi:hypothetical protein